MQIFIRFNLQVNQLNEVNHKRKYGFLFTI